MNDNESALRQEFYRVIEFGISESADAGYWDGCPFNDKRTIMGEVLDRLVAAAKQYAWRESLEHLKHTGRNITFGENA